MSIFYILPIAQNYYHHQPKLFNTIIHFYPHLQELRVIKFSQHSCVRSIRMCKSNSFKCKCKTDFVMSEFLCEHLKVTNDKLLEYSEVNSQSYIQIQILKYKYTSIHIQIHLAHTYWNTYTQAYKYNQHTNVIRLTSMPHYVFPLAQIQHGRCSTYSSY